MPIIIPRILTLAEYLCLLKINPSIFKCLRCAHCGRANPWQHGCYYRKADRSNKDPYSLNPIPIQRFYCKACKKTCSALPECIPPRRWYLWDIQQAAFLLTLYGKSLCAAAKETIPSRQTLSRWLTHLAQKFQLHKDVLCGHFINLGRTAGLTDFWKSVFKLMGLSQAMYLCHIGGVFIP